MAAVAAIMIADLIGLKYSASAGIITILSIQNTKRETLRVAARRGMAFACALVIAAACYRIFGFHIGAFAVYLLCFSCLCLHFGWMEAIATDSVLITHFLTEGNMGKQILGNEILIFVVGAGIGILANLHLHRKAEQFDSLAERADDQMKRALNAMKRQLQSESLSSLDVAARKDEMREVQNNAEEAPDETVRQLLALDTALETLKDCAYRNWNNTLFKTSVYETEYASMRSRQAEVLHRISASMELLESIPKQANMVAELLGKIAEEYDRDNTVEALLDELTAFYENMRRENLPQTRQEFEARAVLFYVLKQIEEFLKIKRQFILKCGGN